MLPTTIRSPPSLGDFISLEEYQSQTPESFIDGKPVLHLHLTGVKAKVPKSAASQLGSAFAADTAQADSTNGNVETVIEQEVDVFVSSGTFTVFSSKAEAGTSIPYPAISIHATKNLSPEAETPTLGLWMLLDFADGGDSDDDFATIEMTLIPEASTDATVNTTQKLYDAIAECSNLHPDPNGEDDDEEGDGADYDDDRIIFEGSAEHEALEGFSGVLRGASDGSLPPPMPGSGGWITAENVNQFFDADGNWIGPAELGEGAGRARGHDEVEDGDANEAQDEAKRPRVDQPPSES